MARTKLYLDTRAVKSGNPAPLKVAINKKSETALISLNVLLLPSQWDKRAGKVVNHPNRLFLNNYITRRMLDIDTMVLKLTESGEIGNMSALDIKRHILHQLSPEKQEDGKEKLFAKRFLKFAESKKESTRFVYMNTYRRLGQFCEDFDKLTFEDITKEWLTSYDTYLSQTSPSRNARNVHFRNIRAVFNEAIDDGVTKAYPFRRFKIRPVATVKRSFTVEQLRMLFNAPTDEHTEKALDIFKLIFLLIGINIIDLCKLREITNGRIEFYRSKTNRLYSIKVEPEALEIINKHKGAEYMINVLDIHKTHRSYTCMLNKQLKEIGVIEGDENSKALFPNLTTYWARHTWATLAAELEIPKETIAAALGHGGNTVTDIYIDFDRKKVDEANRRVIDWVLYGKR